MANSSSSSPSIPTEPAQKTIALLQLTRLGDIVQTNQMVQELRKNHPNFRVILIARKQFVDPLRFLIKDSFDEILSLDFNSFFKTGEQLSLSLVQNNIQIFTSKISSQDIDVLINLSFSKTSNYLAGLISAKNKVGPYFDNKNNIQIHDKWSQFLYSNVMTGPMNPYNLVDLFKNIVGVIPKNKLTLATEFKKKNKVILHPFASQKRKHWKSSKWVEIIYKLSKNKPDLKISIVGSQKDLKETNEILNNPLLRSVKDKIIVLAGKLNLEELYNSFDDRTLFVGHDSMVGHLAASKGVQCMTLSLGNVRPSETTPYGEKNYNLAPKTKCFPCFPQDECNFFQCHADIPYQVVVSSIEELCDSGKITEDNLIKASSSFHLNSVDIFESSFSKKGYFQLKNIISINPSTQAIMKDFYKISWLYIFNQVEEFGAYSKLSKKTHSEILVIMGGLQHLFELSEFGKKYSRYILEEISSQTPNLVKMKEYSAKVDEIDSLLQVLKANYPILSPIVDYSTVAKANLHGENIVQLTESSFYVFEEVSSLTRIVYELSEQTISEYKLKNKPITGSVRL